MRDRRSRRAAVGLTVVCIAAWAVALVAAATPPLNRLPVSTFLHPAIAYATQPASDVVADLNRRIDAGEVRLTYEEPTGYLRPVLDALRVPVESQMLAISKTGIQALYTEPKNPRSIFFNDDVSVGYINGAPLLELAVQDPRQGVIFYTVEQKAQPNAHLERRSNCLSCHNVASSLYVPGMLFRSSAVARDGLAGGSDDPDDRTPFAQRWGGWYVTGTHGAMRHMGNVAGGRSATDHPLFDGAAMNRTSLDGAFDVSRYASSHSDIVALLVFGHQVRMMNLITRVGWDARVAAYGHSFDPAAGVLRDGIEEFVDALLFVDEAPLTDTVKGTSGFAEMFSKAGPSDGQGRSLRQLDLDHRLMKYRCSYMIYSAAFRALPDELRTAIYRRAWNVLSGRDVSPKYADLKEADRRAVMDILKETVSDLPSEFRASH